MSRKESAVLFEAFGNLPDMSDASIADRRAFLDTAFQRFSAPDGVRVEPLQLGGRPAEKMVGSDVGADTGPVMLYLHGGGYVLGSLASHRHLCGFLAAGMAGTVYALDYRLAPEHVYPAAVDDAIAAYEALLMMHPDRPLIIAGDSAGGGLSFATAIRARDGGLRQPDCLVTFSPWVTMSSDADAFTRLAGADPLLSKSEIDWFAAQYLGDTCPTDAGASPLLADLTGLPPVLLQATDQECFLDDVVNMHKKLSAAGVTAELSVTPALYHVWHLHWPMLGEARAALDEATEFVACHCRKQ